ncbi:hypothetical protein Tco_0384019, partial [Tanacetum coccineum]
SKTRKYRRNEETRGRFLALVLQLQIGYGYRQARMPLVESYDFTILQSKNDPDPT